MEKVIKKVKLKEQHNDFAYWQTKSYAERLEAIEILRQQYINYHNVKPGLQRDCTVIKRTRG